MIRQAVLVVLVAAALATAPAGAAVASVDDLNPAITGDGPPADAETCSFPVTRTDATGTDVTVGEDPDDVFVLGPSAAQTMWEIDAEAEVVGVSYGDISYVDYLPGIENRTNAGSTLTPSIGVVVDEDPDVVLAANVVPDSVVDSLRDAGLTVYKFREADSVEFVADKTRLYGELVGRCEDANARADRMETEVRLVREAVADVDRPGALYLLGGGFAAGDETFVDEIVETAGVRNVAADQFDGYEAINTEVVLAEDPTWLIRTSEFDTSEYAGATFEEEGNYVDVDDNYMNQPGPLIVEPMKTIVEVVHPDAYERANLSEPSDAASPTATDDTATTGSGPGLGVFGALAGVLLAAALLARRR